MRALQNDPDAHRDHSSRVMCAHNARIPRTEPSILLAPRQYLWVLGDRIEMQVTSEAGFTFISLPLRSGFAFIAFWGARGKGFTGSLETQGGSA